MAPKFQAPRGTRDIQGAEIHYLQEIEANAAALFRHYGFREIRLPAFESRELFERSVGADTDIVTKEMYVFSDSKGREFALRPEATAGAVRAYIENSLGASGLPVKLWYGGGMFRHERPQAGRYRQFHQIGAELFNAGTVEADLEIVLLAARLLSRLSIEAEFRVNHLGCPTCRASVGPAIVAALAPRASELCPDCRTRLDRNPLRVLDCKVPSCREIVSGRSYISLCDSCVSSFAAYREGLAAAGVRFSADSSLVRGLDYYTGLVFEAVAEGLGAQNAVLGGGRYDGLVQELGGAPTPAVGFAAGLERLAALMAERGGYVEPRPFVHVVGIGDVGRKAAGRAAFLLRRLFEDRARGVGAQVEWIEQDLQARSLKSALKVADKLGAPFVVIIGDDEAKASAATIREMSGGAQTTIRFSGTMPLAEFAASFEAGIAALRNAPAGARKEK